MTDTQREYAESLGYRHYRCCVCGWSGWTDGDPAAECYCGPEEEEEPLPEEDEEEEEE